MREALKETSKVYRRMGEKVGIKAERISQRGIIARRFLETYEAQKLELIDMELRRRIRVA